MSGGEGQNEGSRYAESAMCWLCNEQELVPDYVWILLEMHVLRLPVWTTGNRICRAGWTGKRVPFCFVFLKSSIL